MLHSAAFSLADPRGREKTAGATRSRDFGYMKIVAGNSNRPLAEAVAAFCNLPLVNASIRRFSDQEVFVEIHENVRGEDMFIIVSGEVGVLLQDESGEQVEMVRRRAG